IYFQVGINFMKAEDQGFAAQAGFTVLTKFVKENTSSSPKWKFDKIKINDISLDVRTQAFTLAGYVIFRENDPIYGTGFSGGADLGLKSLNLQVRLNCIFGAKDDYKYFYVDGMVALPTPVVIGTGVALYRFMGGLYYHMKQPEGNTGKLYTSAFSANTPPNYIPDNTIGIGFKAGVTIGLVGKEDAFNADVALEVQFNDPSAGGGLSLIKFTGDCFLMTSIHDREGKTYTQVPVGAFIYIGYDFNKPEFHAILNVAINYDGIQGQMNSVLHIDPQDWYVYIGKPSQRGYLNIYDVATLSSYFMVGTKIEPMPDLPPPIADYFGKPNHRNDGDIQNAKGFAFGAELNTSAQNSFGFDFFNVYGNVSIAIGFDVMLQKFPPSYKCSNTNKTPGFKGWFVKGDLYGYLDASVGIKGSCKLGSFDEKICSFSGAMLLYGELPKPSYIEGHVACEYKVLGGLKKGNFDFDFKKGTRCEG
ncbi:MAG TPA: hypothetical protein VFM99_08470, partial [Chitinophagales bacterium]|nr:hypothetical protein [Chitinophagales bacterium]